MESQRHLLDVTKLQTTARPFARHLRSITKGSVSGTWRAPLCELVRKERSFQALNEVNMQQFRTTSHQDMRVEFISHFSPTHTEEAFCCMKTMRSKGELCDVNLLVGEPQRRISAHRLVLASCSPYFQAMFTSELIESRQRDITLQDVDADARTSWRLEG